MNRSFWKVLAVYRDGKALQRGGPAGLAKRRARRQAHRTLARMLRRTL